MDYYELFQSKEVENPIVVMKLEQAAYTYGMKKAEFEALERLKVAYYSGREFEEPCDILTEPTFLVSELIKKTLTLYDKEILFKGVQLFPTAEESGSYPLYWVPLFRELDCLHKDTMKQDNGLLKNLVLAKEKIAGHSVFRIGGILEYKVAVSLPVAESILRRRPYGVGLRKIEVR
jgi:hypothetical protein